VKKTWFYSLALALGVSALPGTVAGQYSIVNPGAGLSASSFNANPAGVYIPGIRTPAAPPMDQASLAAYSQDNAIGSGVRPGEALNAPAANPSQNLQYQPQRNYTAPPAPHYEPGPSSLVQPIAPQSNYGAHDSGAPIEPSSCPACNSGFCATHGIGMHGNQLGQSSPVYGATDHGNSESCYAPSGISCGPSITSPSPWIFGASGLLFNRIDTQYVRLTSDSNMPENALLSTNSARMRATGGFEVSAGRYFCDGRYALIGSYWGIFSNPQTSTITAPAGGNLRSNLPFTLSPPGALAPFGIEMPGQDVYNWYDGAFAHRLVRDQQFHNVELNLFSFALGGGARQAYAECGDASGCGSGGRLRGAMRGRSVAGMMGNCYDPCESNCETTACSTPRGPTGPCAPWYGAQCSKLRLNMFGGIRWFRFQDSLEYATSETDAVWGSTADDFYYRNGVTNDLVGFQLGSMAQWCTGRCVNLFAGTSFGVFGNQMTADTRAGTTTTVATILSANSFNGRPYEYSNSLTDVALLAEGNLGAGFRISRGWTANLGYRVVGVNGVATAVGQIPRDFSLGNDLNRINNHNSLILHGLVVGAAYNF
jgi:hypothetical protein